MIDAALLRPRMYFRDLEHLESSLRGHAWAFDQLGLVERGESFGPRFSEWLYKEKGSSGAAAGWAYAIRELAEVAGFDAEKLFNELVREFLSIWMDPEG
ncbi:MAG TPA: hypothetical protein ENK57_02940 [Polyangiaceae bacterium]|nr:hypothetical protein [Polyangiaceae bacterium]